MCPLLPSLLSNSGRISRQNPQTGTFLIVLCAFYCFVFFIFVLYVLALLWNDLKWKKKNDATPQTLNCCVVSTFCLTWWSILNYFQGGGLNCRIHRLKHPSDEAELNQVSTCGLKKLHYETVRFIPLPSRSLYLLMFAGFHRF